MEILGRGVEGVEDDKTIPGGLRFDLSNSYGECGKSDGDKMIGNGSVL